MEDNGEGKKKFSAGTIVFWLAILGVIGYFVAPSIINPPKDIYTDGLKDPESALRTYQATAYRFSKMQEGVGFMEMEKVVPESDWVWYEGNLDTISQQDFGHEMRDDVLGGVDPTTGAAIKKRIALNMVIESGCYDPGSKIMDKQIGETEATFTCRTMDIETASQTDWKVKVIKDGKYWRVIGFACGKDRLFGTTAPGVITVSPLNRDEAKAKPAAAASTKEASTETEGEPAADGSPLGLLGEAEPEPESSGSPLDALSGSDASEGGEAAGAPAKTNKVADDPAADEGVDPFGVSADADAAAEGGEGSDPLAALGGGEASAEKPALKLRKEDGSFDGKAGTQFFADQLAKKGDFPGAKGVPAKGGPGAVPVKGGAPQVPAAGAKPPAPGAKAPATAAKAPVTAKAPAASAGSSGSADPALLAPADALLKQAAEDWNKERYRQAVANAQKALTIYQRNLGEDHPKIAEVQKMIEAAKEKAGDI